MCKFSHSYSSNEKRSTHVPSAISHLAYLLSHQSFHGKIHLKAYHLNIFLLRWSPGLGQPRWDKQTWDVHQLDICSQRLGSWQGGTNKQPNVRCSPTWTSHVWQLVCLTWADTGQELSQTPGLALGQPRWEKQVVKREMCPKSSQVIVFN